MAEMTSDTGRTFDLTFSKTIRQGNYPLSGGKEQYR